MNIDLTQAETVGHLPRVPGVYVISLKLVDLIAAMKKLQGIA